MKYSVTPFVAKINSDQGAEAAAKQLEALINENSEKGREFVGLETVEIIIHFPGNPGNKGCFGIGFVPPTPPSSDVTKYDMAVFKAK